MTPSRFRRSLLAAALTSVFCSPSASAAPGDADVYQTFETDGFVVKFLKEGVYLDEGLATVASFADDLNDWPDGIGSATIGTDVGGAITQSMVDAMGFWEQSAGLGQKKAKGETFVGIIDSASSLMAMNLVWFEHTESPLWLVFNQGDKQGLNAVVFNAYQIFLSLWYADSGRTALSRRNFSEQYLETVVHELGHGLGMSSLVGFSGTFPSNTYVRHLTDSLGRPAGSSVTPVIGTDPSLYRGDDSVFFIIDPSVPSSSFASLGSDVGYLRFHGETVDALTNAEGIEVLGQTASATSAFNHLALKASVFGFESRKIMPTVLDMAVFKDIGYDGIRLEDMFGNWWLPYGDAPSSAVNDTSYGNSRTYGVGAHVFRDGFTLTQAGDITMTGRSASGIRVTGVGNSVIVEEGSSVSSNGKYGRGILVDYGSSNRLTVKGTVEALGDTGVGIEVCSGYESYLGDRLLTALPTYKASIDSIRRTQQLNDIYTEVFADMNGPMVTDIDITGRVSGTEAAVLINPTNIVNRINVMGNAEIRGSIAMNGYSPIWNYQAALEQIRVYYETDVTFGLRPDEKGNATSEADPTFHGTMVGNIGDASQKFASNPFHVEVKGGTLDLLGNIYAIDTVISQGATLNFGGNRIQSSLPGYRISSSFLGVVNEGTLDLGAKGGDVVMASPYTQTGTGLLCVTVGPGSTRTLKFEELSRWGGDRPESPVVITLGSMKLRPSEVWDGTPMDIPLYTTEEDGVGLVRLGDNNPEYLQIELRPDHEFTTTKFLEVSESGSTLTRRSGGGAVAVLEHPADGFSRHMTESPYASFAQALDGVFSDTTLSAEEHAWFNRLAASDSVEFVESAFSGLSSVSWERLSDAMTESRRDRFSDLDRTMRGRAGSADDDVWASVYGTAGKLGSSSAFGMRTRSGGVLFGGAKAVGSSKVGIHGTAGSQKAHGGPDGLSASGESFTFGLHGEHRLQSGAWVLASADFGRDDLDSSFTAESAGVLEIRRADMKLDSRRLSLTAGMPFESGIVSLTPFFGAEVLHLTRSAFGEKSGGGRIRLDRVSDTSSSAFVGLSAETTVRNEAGMTLALSGELLYRRIFSDPNRRRSSWTFYGAAGSDVVDTGIGHDRLEANFSAELFITKAFRAGMTAGTVQAKGAASLTGGLQAAWQW